MVFQNAGCKYVVSVNALFKIVGMTKTGRCKSRIALCTLVTNKVVIHLGYQYGSDKPL